MSYPKVDIWIVEEAKNHLEELLEDTMVGLEFGSGMSTIWLAGKVKHLTSVEHDLEWCRRTSKLLEKHGFRNVRICYSPPERYLGILKETKDESLDFVFNDGLGNYRSKCITESWSKIKVGGFIITDNSNAHHSTEGIKYLVESGAQPYIYYGSVTNPWNGRRNEKGVETSIWVK